MNRLLDKLVKALRDAGNYNPDVQVEPQCILWTDRDRQWEPVIPRLQEELPELFILGRYDPNKRTGPAIWIRCVTARKLSDIIVPLDRPLVVYLPGVSRQDLRAIETCNEELKPIAELQYRGVTWTQIANGKDWTVLAFLKSAQGGLGLDVAQDQETKNAMLLALYRILDEDVDLLRTQHLDKDYFNTLLSGRDPARDLLVWLDQGEVFRAQCEANAWQAFVAVCKSQLGFHPGSEGTLAGGAKLAKHEGPWKPIWDRFCEAPKRYPNIPVLIRRCQPPLFVEVFPGQFSGWPQWNDEQENLLRSELLNLASTAARDARSRILELEKRHGSRRKLVWAELGESALALSLEHLVVLADATANSLCAGDCDDLAASYQNFGWCADAAVVQVLSHIESVEDYKAVTAAIRAIYLPWIEDSARHVQRVVEKNGYPGGSISTVKRRSSYAGECVMFVDGLRFDVAKRLSEKLVANGCHVEESPAWAALPSVTSTGKPAVSPVRAKISGLEANSDFEPVVAEGGQSLRGGYQIKKLLTDNGWDILERSAYGDGQGNAWCEFGDIDSEGHDRGWKLCKHLENLLAEIQERVVQLLKSGGWKSVRIVTDHGWLLMPGGLPKIDLPSVLSDSKWGRCAAIKSGAKTQERLYPWFWNPAQHFALADGVSCFRKGEEYAHGGLSLQECLNLELVVSLTTVASPAFEHIEITDIGWKGLRCVIEVDGNFNGCVADLRAEAGNPETSLVVSAKHFKNNGTTSLVVEDEEMEGTEGFVVLVDPNGITLAQKTTRIGGMKNGS